ncbi:unnamed protein product, partial [Staurois parvus]
PKHDSTTALLTLQPCWNRVAVHQPSTTPSIWTIQGCSRGTSSFKYLFVAMQWYFSSCSLDPMHGSGRNLPQCAFICTNPSVL